MFWIRIIMFNVSCTEFISYLVSFSAVHTITNNREAIVIHSRGSRSILSGIVKLLKPSLELIHATIRNNKLWEDGDVGVSTSTGQRIQHQCSRIKFQIFDSKTTIHMRFDIFQISFCTTTQNLTNKHLKRLNCCAQLVFSYPKQLYLDSFFSNLLNQSFQLILNFIDMCKEASSTFVSLTTHHLVSQGSKPIVETFFGSSLWLGIEFCLVRRCILAFRDIKNYC